MMLRVIPAVKPYFPIEDVERIKSDLEKILQSGMLTLFTYTKEFEKKFADLCRVNYATAVNSGTSALEIALRTMELKGGDEVLVPTNTFTATAATIFFAGGKPVFTDIDPKSLCIDADNVQRYITQKTKGVIAVHIGGLICPEIKAIKEVCDDYNLFLIEDAAHAHGSTTDEQPAGSLGDIGCFSFYPTKVMTTGEGGMITTNDVKVAEKARVLRDQGKENFNSNIIIELGYNWRLPEINAAIGIVQLEKLPEIIEKRNRIARYYGEELDKISGIKPLEIPSNTVSNYYKYIVILDHKISRDEFKRKLSEKDVKCGGEVYWPPLHLQPIYQKLLGLKKGDFPVAEEVCERMVCLPMFAQMTLEDAGYVIEKINETLFEL